MSPEGPLSTRGGTTSGRPSYSYVQDSGPPFSKEMSIVIQVSRPTPKQTAPSATTKISMGKETPLSNAAKKRSDVPFDEVSSVFLILPSYAEKHKTEIKQIIANEKTKLCCSKFYHDIFNDA